MELASYNFSGAQSFGVGHRFMENACPPLLGYKEHLLSLELHNSITFISEF
jgi:hypothetical protein